MNEPADNRTAMEGRDSRFFVLPDLLARFLALLCRSILWLAAALAVASRLRHPVAESAWSRPEITAAWVLACSVGLLLFLSHAEGEPNSGRRTLRRYDAPVAALLCGFLLPFPWFFPYAVFLGAVELAGRYGFRTRRRKTRHGEPDNLGELDEADDPEDADLLSDERTTRQTVRLRTEEGRDRLEGTFRIEFRDDQLTSSVHIPFCPPFETVPSVQAFLLDEADAKLSVADPQLFGVRVDVKRDRSAPLRLRIAVLAEDSVPIETNQPQASAQG